MRRGPNKAHHPRHLLPRRRQEGLLSNTSVLVGFKAVSTDDFDEIIRQIRERIGNDPLYLRWV